MFYCPKCQQNYKESNQRFCLNDGERLLPAPSAESSLNRSGGVFSGILERIAPNGENNLNLPPTSKFIKNEPVNTNFSNFALPLTNQIFKSETEIEPELEIEKEVEIETEAQKPVPRFIKPNEIPSSQASLGDRKINPNGRVALTWENPDALLGQTVKGRYLVAEKLGEGESSIAYLAEDKLVAGRKVVVRVLMDEDEADDFTNKIFAEERVSLSLVNHPNIARILDSGELLEGMPFIISEYTQGESVEDKLRKTGQFNSLRAARIVRQAADALSEAHRSGVLHRNLTPENIILTVSDSGAEQVKLIDFGVSRGQLSEENIAYKSPEQLEGKLANYASDIYSLAVIAYRMLTNRLPFDSDSVKNLIELQRENLTLRPTNLRLDLPSSVDRILEKALAFNPSERYPKARDFGDAFANAITTDSPRSNDKESDETEIILPLTGKSFEKTAENQETISAETFDLSKEKNDALISAGEDNTDTEDSLKTDNLPWERRSPEKPQKLDYRFLTLAVLGGLLLLSGIVGGWIYLLNRQEQQVIQTPVETVFPVEPLENANSAAPTPEEIESPPLPRTITQPPNTNYFQNSKENLTGDLRKNFLGFSLYYPKTWKENDAQGKFLDISKNAPSGTISEQMLVSYYDSKGTYKTDAELFPSLVKETNSTLKKIVPNYEVVSEGEKTINNGWRAYEVKFKGSGISENGEKITLWGRRLFIPTGIRGMKNGYVITMLATSLSPDVKSADDVGVKGDLAGILETFEPNQNF